MSEQQMQMSSTPVEMQVSEYVGPTETDSSFSLWTWMFIMFLFGLFILGVYYYFLYFYDASSIEDAIEKAFKHFNEKTTAAREDVGITGNTGATE